jgi:hypothetical protein
MAILPLLIQSTRRRAADSGLTPGPPARGPVSALAEGAKSSMFAEMPLDNRTVKETATWTAVDARGCANLRTKGDEESELIFRRHHHFRNIETYIRQYD